MSSSELHGFLTAVRGNYWRCLIFSPYGNPHFKYLMVSRCMQLNLFTVHLYSWRVLTRKSGHIESQKSMSRHVTGAVSRVQCAPLPLHQAALIQDQQEQGSQGSNLRHNQPISQHSHSPGILHFLRSFHFLPVLRGYIRRCGWQGCQLSADFLTDRRCLASVPSIIGKPLWHKRKDKKT